MGSRCWTPASSGFSPTHQRYWSYLDLLVENDWLLSQQGGTFLCQSATNHTSLRIAWVNGDARSMTQRSNLGLSCRRWACAFLVELSRSVFGSREHIPIF